MKKSCVLVFWNVCCGIPFGHLFGTSSPTWGCYLSCVLAWVKLQLLLGCHLCDKTLPFSKTVLIFLILVIKMRIPVHGRVKKPCVFWSLDRILSASLQMYVVMKDRTHPILIMKFHQKIGFLHSFGQTDRPQFIKVSDNKRNIINIYC